MAVTTYAASGELSFSAFRTTVVGASDSVSMSKLTARNASTSTSTTDIQYFGTNVPWNESGVVGTNLSIPDRTSGDPTPAISVSDLHGAIPWFYTFRTNVWGFDQEQVLGGKDESDTYSNNLYWDNVLVLSNSGQTSAAATITTGGFTYYRGQYTGYGRSGFLVYRIGRD